MASQCVNYLHCEKNAYKVTIISEILPYQLLLSKGGFHSRSFKKQNQLLLV